VPDEVGVNDGVFVLVLEAVPEKGVSVGEAVGVPVSVAVDVPVGVKVGVEVLVFVGVNVGVLVLVGVAAFTEPMLTSKTRLTAIAFNIM